MLVSPKGLWTLLAALKCYLKAVVQKKVPNPGTKTFETVRAFCGDVLQEAKLACFVSVSKLIEPFLTLYQTDKVMMPFLCEDLENLVKKIMRRYLKVDKKVSAMQLLAMDLDSSENQLENANIEVGYVAGQTISKNKISQRVAMQSCMQFRMEAKAFMKAIIVKMMNKCPLKYKLVRSLSCLNPKVLVKDYAVAAAKFRRVLQCLVDAERISVGDADQLFEDFSDWATCASSSTAFKNFCQEDDTVDSLYYANFPKEQYPVLWGILKELLLLSHGQAAVERGFSLGKAVAKENQLPETIVKMRLVKDHIVAVGGIKHVVVTNEMLTMVSSAHQKYMEDLERKKQENAKKKTREKRKALSQEIEMQQKKRKIVHEAMISLQAESVKLYEKAEVTTKISFVVSANSLRKTASEKESECKRLDAEIKEKQDRLMNMM